MSRAKFLVPAVFAIVATFRLESDAEAQDSPTPPRPFVADSTEWQAIAPGSGHPFWNSDRPRPTLLNIHRDDQVTRASYDRPTEARTAPPPATTAPPPAAAEHPLAPVIAWAHEALGRLDAVHDYTCTFIKREEIGGSLQEQQVIFAKARLQPFSVYLQFLSPNKIRGQEAIYVAGANGGKLLAHPVGFKHAIVGTVALDPGDPQATENDRYRITDFGLKRMTERYLEAAMLDIQFNDCEVRRIENARVADRPCTCWQITHATPRQELRHHVTRLYVDDELRLPIRFEAYGWPRQQGDSPPLVEEYTYQGLKLNVGLGDVDFDAKNPNYRF